MSVARCHDRYPTRTTCPYCGRSGLRNNFGSKRKHVRACGERFTLLGREKLFAAWIAEAKKTGRVDWRRAHLHNLSIVDPELSEPWNDGAKFQSDLPRKLTLEMVSRLTENPVTIDVSSTKENSTRGLTAPLCRRNGVAVRRSRFGPRSRRQLNRMSHA